LPGRRYTALIQAVDPLVDTSGRSVGVRACIDNRQLQLRPGMFARVTAVFGVRDNAKVVPEEAIVPQGQKAYVIKVVDGPEKDSKLSQRVEVKVGIRRPGRVEITEGLNEGDTVVIAGQQRIQKDGSALRILEVNRPRGEGAPAGVPGAAMAAASSAGPVPAASAAAMPASAAKAIEGPNPCLVDLTGVASRRGEGGKSGAEPPARRGGSPDAAAKS
jgi:membrane fusion protein (multidrug efflux system)